MCIYCPGLFFCGSAYEDYKACVFEVILLNKKKIIKCITVYSLVLAWCAVTLCKCLLRNVKMCTGLFDLNLYFSRCAFRNLSNKPLAQVYCFHSGYTHCWPLISIYTGYLGVTELHFTNVNFLYATVRVWKNWWEVITLCVCVCVLFLYLVLMSVMVGKISAS